MRSPSGVSDISCVWELIGAAGVSVLGGTGSLSTGGAGLGAFCWLRLCCCCSAGGNRLGGSESDVAGVGVSAGSTLLVTTDGKGFSLLELCCWVSGLSCGTRLGTDASGNEAGADTAVLSAVTIPVVTATGSGLALSSRVLCCCCADETTGSAAGVAGADALRAISVDGDAASAFAAAIACGRASPFC